MEVSDDVGAPGGAGKHERVAATVAEEYLVGSRTGDCATPGRAVDHERRPDLAITI